MMSSFRQSMAWVHTWFGLTLGFVLMVCFFFGSLSVFDREIDRWAMPDTRFAAQPMPSFDQMLKPFVEGMHVDEEEYRKKMPKLHDASQGLAAPRMELKPDRISAYTTHRDPVLALSVDFLVPTPKDPAHEHLRSRATIDPRDGRVLDDGALKIGSKWFYPLHYSLQLKWMRLGSWIVGLAALAMLAALVTGVIMHRKIFREFFTFRPRKNTQRSTLDLHNLSGVVGLPFHFFFALTGLIIFAGIYFPIGHTTLSALHDEGARVEAREKNLPQTRSGVPAPIASVDAMAQEARRRWAARDMPGEVGFLRIHHYGDRNSYVSIYRAGADQVALVGQGVHFEASTGRVLHEEPPNNAIIGVHEFMRGLHLQHFRHWLLRWLYVVGGLLGCVCIATGFVFFVEKRRQSHARSGSAGARVVDAMAVFMVTGMVIATVSMLVANRLLPEDLGAHGARAGFAGIAGKGDWEIAVFWFAWVASLAHATLRSGAAGRSIPARSTSGRAGINPAWREQCWCIAVLAVCAVLLNAVTTGDHLIRTVFTDTYWPVAGLDLAMLTTAALAAFAARKLRASERDRDLDRDLERGERTHGRLRAIHAPSGTGR